MPEGEKFVDQAKARLLYEHQQGSDIGAMLEQSDTNSRISERMVAKCTIMGFTRVAWRGNWSGVFGDVVGVLQRHYLNLEGYARLQAIDMSKARMAMVSGGMVEDKKKGGIVGLLGK